MAVYPGSETETKVDPARLGTDVAAVFMACGMSAADAGLLAASLVKADQRGIHSHGVLRVPDYVEKLTVGGVDPRGQPRLASERGGALVIDGGNAMGQIVADFAMRAAIARARETGVAVAAARGSNHCGTLDQWVLLAAAEGMVGIAATNALPTMAPWGGVEKIVGMNPVGVAFPAGEEPPVVLDLAFGATAHGKIRVYAQKGEPIPEGWACDAEGRPTTDTAKALDGLIQPVGGFKGIGLAVMSGMLATLLSGAAYGTELGNMVDGPRPGADGHVFVAIDVAAFRPLDEVRARVDAIARQLRLSRAVQPGTALYPPGGLEHELEQRHAAGIPLNEATLEGVRAAARRLGVAVEI
jgi:L-2-hydroxycarboxylate dehydrogenase (NAD+)